MEPATNYPRNCQSEGDSEPELVHPFRTHSYSADMLPELPIQSPHPADVT